MHLPPTKRSQRNVVERELSPTYFPCSNTVLIGRGRKALENTGNIRFRALLAEYLEAYSTARKAKKSSIIKQIINRVRANSVENIGFVKQAPSTGWFIAVSDQHAKVYIAQQFRDRCLQDTYKSSKHYKQFKRDCDRSNTTPTFEAFTKALAAGTINPADGQQADADLKQVSDPTKDAAGSNMVSDPEENDGGSEDSSHGALSHDNDDPLHNEPVLEKPLDSTYEPIPLSQAMDITFENISFPPTSNSHNHEHHSANEASDELSFCHGCNEEEKEEARLMVSCGGCDFIDCPQCSRLQGRAQYDDYLVSIPDVREALIGGPSSQPRYAAI